MNGAGERTQGQAGQVSQGPWDEFLLEQNRRDRRNELADIRRSLKRGDITQEQAAAAKEAVQKWYDDDKDQIKADLQQLYENRDRRQAMSEEERMSELETHTDDKRGVKRSYSVFDMNPRNPLADVRTEFESKIREIEARTSKNESERDEYFQKIEKQLQSGNISPDRAASMRALAEQRFERERQKIEKDRAKIEGKFNFDRQGKFDETPAEYGERLSNGYNMKVVAEHIRRNMDRRIPETQQHHIERVKAFMTQYPRQNNESLAQYEKRIDELFKSGAVDSDWGLDANAGDPNGEIVTPGGDANGSGEDNPDRDKPKIGDVILDKIDIQIEEADNARKEQLEQELNSMLPELAELYARSRRLITGANRARLHEATKTYNQKLNELLKLRADVTYEQGQRDIMDTLDAKINELPERIKNDLLEFAGGDLDNTEKTQEEIDAEKARLIEAANAEIRAIYDEKQEELKGKISAEFIQSLIEQEADLEAKTIDRLDNGTILRRVVSRVITNPILKGVLTGAAVAGLAVSGIGLATGIAAGTVSVGLGYTAGGVALGAARGALAGGIMSRQSSETSAIKGFANNSEEIKTKLEGIDPREQGEGIANVTSWLLGEYERANTTDRQENRKRTLISAGIGGLISGFASGIQINNIDHVSQTVQEQVGTTPVNYEVDLNQVDIPEGYGMMETFTQLGGDPSNYAQAEGIAHSFDAAYGLSPGSNGVVAGYDGTVGNFAHTYPGHINTWPSQVQAYMDEVSQEWARQGLIPSTQIGGEPIYNTITNWTTEEVRNALAERLVQIVADATSAAVGSGIGGTRQVFRREAPPKYDANGNEIPRERPQAELESVQPQGETLEIEQTPQPNANPEQPEGGEPAQAEAQPQPEAEGDNIPQPLPPREVQLTGESNAQQINEEEANETQPEPVAENPEQNIDSEAETADTLLSEEEIRNEFEIVNQIMAEIPEVDEEGVDILMDGDPLTDERRAEIQQWYSGLETNPDRQYYVQNLQSYLRNHPDRARNLRAVIDPTGGLFGGE